MTQRQIDGRVDCFVSGSRCGDDNGVQKSGHRDDSLWNGSTAEAHDAGSGGDSTTSSRVAVSKRTSSEADGVAATTSASGGCPFITNTGSSIDIVFAEEPKRRVLTKNQLRGKAANVNCESI